MKLNEAIQSRSLKEVRFVISRGEMYECARENDLNKRLLRPTSPLWIRPRDVAEQSPIVGNQERGVSIIDLTILNGEKKPERILSNE